MTKISICIPVENITQDPSRLVRYLAGSGVPNLEVVVAAPAGVLAGFPALGALAGDPRLVISEIDGEPALRAIWLAAARAATGDWITLVNPGDTIEPGLGSVARFVATVSKEADAIAWNTFQITRPERSDSTDSIAVPTDFDLHLFDKQKMLKSFFYWDGSNDVPKVPFGLYHGMLRRNLVDVLLELPDTRPWSTPLPRYEWTAKALLCADQLVFCSRPLSAIDVVPFTSSLPTVPHGFPFHSGVGLTAAVAEVQAQVLADLGAPWEGGGPDFVRACMIDCMKEADPDRFQALCRSYFAALQAFEGGRLANLFKPQFRGRPVADTRRGLHGEAIMVDRHLGGARSAPEFFHVVRSILAPVEYIGHQPTA